MLAVLRNHPHRWIAGMLVTSAAALFLGSGVWWFPLLVAVVHALHLFARFRLPGEPGLLTGTFLAVPFVLWYRALPKDGLTGVPPVDLLYFMGFFSVAIGTYHMLTAHDRGKTTHAVSYAVIAFALAGTMSRRLLPHSLRQLGMVTPMTWFLPCVGVFFTLLLLELRRAMGVIGPRSGALGRVASIIVIVSLATGMQAVLIETFPMMSQWAANKLGEHLRRTEAGFSRSTRLGNVSESWFKGREDEVMVRHWSRVGATHLRGAVFGAYQARTWHVVDENRELNADASEHGRNVFVLRGEANSLRQPLGTSDGVPVSGTVFASDEYPDTYFLPLGVERVSAFDDKLKASNAGTLRSPRRLSPGGIRYDAPLTDASRPTSDETGVPQDLAMSLRHLASNITGDAQTPEDKANRIASHFAANFSYRIGLQLTTGKDPVIEFLEDIHAGHCEYFASAATLLLRASGVPARYVTGFVTVENGLNDTYRIARRRDAHAWVEYYTTDKGWITFDPTPPDARPASPPMSKSDRFLDYVKQFAARWWAVTGYAGVGGILAMTWESLIDLILIIPIPIWGVFIAVALAWVYRKQLRTLLKPAAAGEASAEVKALRKSLKRAESLLAPHGIVREPATPVGPFLERVRNAAIPPATKASAVGLLEAYQSRRFIPPSTPQ